MPCFAPAGVGLAVLVLLASGPAVGDETALRHRIRDLERELASLRAARSEGAAADYARGRHDDHTEPAALSTAPDRDCPRPH